MRKPSVIILPVHVHRPVVNFFIFSQAYLTRNEQREGVLLLFKTVSYMLYFFLV